MLPTDTGMRYTKKDSGNEWTLPLVPDNPSAMPTLLKSFIAGEMLCWDHGGLPMPRSMNDYC